LFRPTPGRLIAGLLVFEAFLFLSDRLGWLGLGHHKGWAVLISLASVVVATVSLASLTALAAAFRWRLQFTILSLLAMTVATSLAFSWLAVEERRAKERRAAVNTIKELGGVVDDDGNTDLTWEWLRKLLGDDFFENADVAQLQGLETPDTSLDRIDFKPLPELRGVYLDHTAVTDAGVERLKGLIQLEELRLKATRITDAGLKHLEGLSQLQLLDLERNNVTDAGLEHLKLLSHLKVLRLDSTMVTDEGAKKLQRALPKCEISHEGIFWDLLQFPVPTDN